MSGWDVLLSIILVIIFLISAGLLTKASINIGANNADPNLSTAYQITTWISVLAWILVALSIILFILYMYYYFEGGAEINAVSAYNKLKTNSYSIWWSLFFIIIMIIVAIVGIFSAIAAYYITLFKGFNKNTAYFAAWESCTVSAVLCLVVFVIIIISYIISWTYSEPTPIQSNNINNKQLLNEGLKTVAT